ncbi:Abi family protein [Mobilicoccus massiliensis]|uniref:Abi family protein n=1 Tax=Mobilicoccus massiliensis TaxID=1522310 RepID=UPI0009E50F8F|nr:Abi family protein [Mobilicoccus massiliensis]
MATVKPYTTVDEQVALLQRRGMVLDPSDASHWLRAVGYYRLSGYWYPWRLPGSADTSRRSDDFAPGTRFADVVALYEFDRKLRTLLHDGIERIEVGLRAHVGDLLAAKAPLAYRDPGTFRPTFDHRRWLTTARQRVARASRHHTALQHHQRAYGGDPPVWILTDVLDFRDTSMLYAGLRTEDQWTIADALGVHVDLGALQGNQREKARRSHPLTRWFEQLTVIRNSVAHHARVWNRSFVPASTAALRAVPGLEELPEGQSEQLYGALTLMGVLIESLSPGTSWPERVERLFTEEFDTIPGRSRTEIGFPTDITAPQHLPRVELPTPAA